MKKGREDIFAAANSIPVGDVLSTRIKLRRYGTYQKALCPFHNDRHVGSFMTLPAKNLWKCYACGEHGDNVDFIAQIDRISKWEAAVRILLDFGLITDSEAKDVMNGAPVEPLNYTPRTPVRANVPRSDEHCSRVYEAFASAAGELSKEHYEHIINVRHADGWERDFFEWPNPGNGAFWRRFGEELKKQGILSSTASAVQYVPGFAFNLQTMRPFFTKYTGIGIRLRNADGSISGLQVRIDHPKPGASKYKLFSSSWASYNSNDEAIDGACRSQAADILYPEGKAVGAAITEGRFKAIQLAKMGYIVLSLNGVSNWSYVLPGFLSLIRGVGFSDVHIYFDADMTVKLSVAKAAIALEKAISQEDMDTYFVVWDAAFGKGIDDMLLAGHREDLRMRRGKSMVKTLEPFVQAESEKRLKMKADII